MKYNLVHYVGPGYIPTYVPGYISSRDQNIVPVTSQFHNNMSVHILVRISSPTTDAIQDPINHNSSFLSAVLTIYCDKIDTSTTQKIIIKESFYNINRN